ncbi:class I SAM-dependent methyltransferase [Paenibacillus pini]|uniref:Methyltransferase type 12 n=1 Tax=Paenibacillus pini JCM 16418 TaxID=1236976 RepID=W7YG56_9BACL|nr:class I SAM-dependent methyltransferase [Paenibacillus pini]GAF06533.1 methyltransferase type 12 [Paenibacillus pini JCM 16418]
MSCPLCQSEHTEPFAAYPRHSLMLCSRCDFMYQTNQEQLHIQSLVSEIYNDEWIHMREKYTQSTFLDHALFNTLLLDMFTPRKGTLLEIGSGTAEFLYTAQSAGWKVTGIEPSVVSCQYAYKKYGLSLIQGIWHRDLKQELEPFDAIALWHVLEHMPHPVDLLIELREILKPDGFLFISIPNKNSFTNETLGARSPLYTEYDHLYHYSDQSLRLLLELAGYTVKSLFSRQLPNGLEQLIQANPNYDMHTFEETMSLLTKLQAQQRGHELCCVVQKTTLPHGNNEDCEGVSNP